MLKRVQMWFVGLVAALLSFAAYAVDAIADPIVAKLTLAEATMGLIGAGVLLVVFSIVVYKWARRAL